MKGLSTNKAVYSTSIIEMYVYMMRNSSMPCEEYSESMFRFSRLLLRELMKGLSPN